MKNKIVTLCSSVLLISMFQSVSFADTRQNNSNKMAMMNTQNCMGMMNGRNRMGMMNGQNRMGMMNDQKHMGMMNGRCMNMSMQRHRFVMQNGIPSSYQNTVNSIQSNTAEAFNRGKKLYQTNCASCHGQSGLGDGPAGINLTPRPANIAAFSKMPMASDAYLNWTISEGGAPISSPMPAFKNLLNEQETWQIINYLRQI